MNNPINLIDPTGKDWISYKDKEGITHYEWRDDIHSREELREINRDAEYHGLTFTKDNTYFSLFGQVESLDSNEGKVVQAIDDAIIKYASYLKELQKDPEAIQASTNFDVGIYLRRSDLMLSEDPVISFKYGTSNDKGMVYYYAIGDGVPNKGTFEAWGKDVWKNNSNRNTGNMIGGYNVLFPRNGGSNQNISIRWVFPTLGNKNKMYETYRKLLFHEK